MDCAELGFESGPAGLLEKKNHSYVEEKNYSAFISQALTPLAHLV